MELTKVLTFLCKVFVWLIFLNNGLSFFTSAVWKEDFIEAWISLFIVQKLHKLIHCQVRFFLCTTEKTVSTKLVPIHVMFLIHCTGSSFLQVNNCFSAHSSSSTPQSQIQILADIAIHQTKRAQLLLEKSIITLKQCSTKNQQQNFMYLRHLALEGFRCLPTSKRENETFTPHPLHAMLCRYHSFPKCAMFQRAKN